MTLIQGFLGTQLGYAQIQHGRYRGQKVLFHCVTRSNRITTTDRLNQTVMKHDNATFGLAADHALHSNAHGFFERGS